MPEINPSLPRASYKFMGHAVTIPANWKEGDTLDANSTKFINRALASTVGNLLGQRLRREVEALQKAEDAKPEADRRRNPEDPTKFYVFTAADVPTTSAQSYTDEIFTAYQPGVSNTRSGSGGSAHDPVQSIADSIAWEKIKTQLAKRNIAINKVKAEKRRELIEQYHAKFPDILEQAKAIFAASADTTEADADDGLDFSTLDNGDDTQGGDSGTDTVSGSDTTPGTDTQAGDDSLPGTDSDSDATPDSPPSSTVETDGATASELGSTPSNPGTVGTTHEGTGQGTPGKGGARGGTKDSGAGLPDTPAPSNPPAAFS